MTSRSKRFAQLAGFWLMVVGCVWTMRGQAAQAPSPGRAPAFGEKGAPGPGYHAAFPYFYDGDYRTALDRFMAEGRSCIKNGQQRWIDSICYETMVGECYFQMGMLNKALDHYTAALKLYLATPNWLIQVNFAGVTIRESNRRVAVPWVARPPQARFGHFPDRMNISQGSVDISETVRSGGPVQQAMLYPIEPVEIIRATALAMRRRTALLGPMAAQDTLSDRLDATVARHPILNHWSDCWVYLLSGLAKAGAGREGPAVTHLQRATLAGGEFEHPLSGVAHLELGRLAMVRGDYDVASKHFEEASYASVYYDDLGTLEEAFRYGALTHLMANRRGLFPPLAPAILWAKAKGFRQVQASLLLLAAESHAAVGQTAQAAAMLKDAGMAVGNRTMKNGRIGARWNFLEALVLFQQGKVPEGDAALAKAMKFMQQGSLWLFHIALADSMYTGGSTTARVAIDLYKELLRDPRPADWANDPMEALAVLTSPHPLPYEHWFEVALARKEHENAIECADRARRHRFFTAMELGGRVEALRWVLDGPMEMLDAQTQLQRQDLLTRYPAYDKLRQQVDGLRKKLADMPLVAKDKDNEALKKQAQGLEQLAALGRQQEVALREIALRREPATMAFPPLRSTAEVQKALPKGHAMLVFFATSRAMYAFLLNNEKYAFWQVSVTPQVLQRQATALLRDMGNYAPNHDVTLKDLGETKWTKPARGLLDDLLRGSRADFSKKFDELVIVPDGVLWYVPFETLQVQVEGKWLPLISRFRIRYSPTAGLASGPAGWGHRPMSKTAVVLGRLFPKQDDEVASAAFAELAKALPGCVAIKPPAPAPASAYAALLDRLVVFDDLKGASEADPFAWTPLASDRTKVGATLADWMELPWGCPEEIVLPGFHTLAEESLKGMNRSSMPGNEIFLSLCGLMASGARTVLISRWRTGGQTSFDLVREFTQELPHVTPTEAWQRAVLLVAGQRLSLEAEPRVKRATADEAPKANHPFFWSGYMLVDMSCAEAKAEPAPAGPVIKVRPPAAKPAAKPVAPPVPGLEKPEENPPAEKPKELQAVEKPRPAPAEPPPAQAKPPAEPAPKKPGKPQAADDPDQIGPRIP
jgi:CHAT domain-containing protein